MFWQFLKDAKHDVPEHLNYGRLLKDLQKEIRAFDKEIRTSDSDLQREMLSFQTSVCTGRYKMLNVVANAKNCSVGPSQRGDRMVAVLLTDAFIYSVMGWCCSNVTHIGLMWNKKVSQFIVKV